MYMYKSLFSRIYNILPIFPSNLYYLSIEFSEIDFSAIELYSPIVEFCKSWSQLYQTRRYEARNRFVRFSRSGRTAACCSSLHKRESKSRDDLIMALRYYAREEERNRKKSDAYGRYKRRDKQGSRATVALAINSVGVEFSDVLPTRDTFKRSVSGLRETSNAQAIAQGYRFSVQIALEETHAAGQSLNRPLKVTTEEEDWFC